MNVDDFLQQQKMTEEKIAKLERIIQEGLPKMEQDLINQYKEEKVEHLRKAASLNFIEERAEENKSFYNLTSSKEAMAEKETSEERYNGVRR